MRDNYNGNLTGVGFFLTEFKIVLKKILEGNEIEEIKKEIIDFNLFQYSKTSSLTRITPTILRRCTLISDNLKTLAIEDTIETSKLINLLAIIEEDDLFYTFMNEIVRESYRNSSLLLGKKEVNLFFTEMREKSPKVDTYKESTFGKLRQVYLKILVDSSLLNTTKDGELRRIYLDANFRNILIEDGYKYFVNILEGQ